ncbi:MAG: hypothetical protein Q7U92_04995, partial [Bradyrhizobium sp.]|nr:hypothetical protein [Bradyrhizobium sp.]
MTSTGSDTVIGNARIVLADRVIERGWIAFANGRIAECGEGSAPAGSVDATGDMIMPGLHGLDFVLEIARRCPGLPVVMMSVQSGKDWDLNADEAGIYFLQ